MKTTKEMIEVMQAYDIGEKIECFNDDYEQWRDVNNPIWDWLHNDYRVKPNYAPFDTADEFLTAQREHGICIIACEELYANSYIDCYCSVFLYNGDGTNVFTFNFETLLENCTFADGTPCGKEIEL